MCGRPVIFNKVRKHSNAILCTWWLGSEAGNAIYNVLLGKYNPSAKLPMTFPTNIGQIPIFTNIKVQEGQHGKVYIIVLLILTHQQSLPIHSDLVCRILISNIATLK